MPSHAPHQLYLAQRLDLGVASADVPAVDMSGSKIRWYTPAQMILDVGRVSACYRLGVWPLPELEYEEAGAESGGAENDGWYEESYDRHL